MKKQSSKICKDCNLDKSNSDFSKNKRKPDGLEIYCKDCMRQRKKKYRESNKGKKKIKAYREYYNNSDKGKEYNRERTQTDSYKEYSREYRKKNKDKIRESKKIWESLNKDAVRANKHRLMARERGLLVDFTREDYRALLNIFDWKCSLTGKNIDIQLDHFISLSTGHGGTYLGNMIPLSKELNQSKLKSNPFEWVKKQPKDIQDNFINVVRLLAKQNGLEPKVFEEYVYWCYENKRTKEDIMKDGNIKSIDLWKSK